MPELATAWVTLAASTRGMERDVKQAFDRVERGSKITPKVDTSGLSAQASRAGRDFGSRFSSASGSGFSAGGGKAAGMFVGAFAGVASAAAFTALAAAGARAYVAQFQSILNTGLDFSRTMNNFQGVTRASATEMRNMQNAARQLGADTTLAGTSASSAATAMTELAKAGFSVDQSITAARGTLQLATAGQIDAAKAAEIQANAMNAFGLGADSAAHTADLLANAAIASSADIPDIGLALQQVGGVAHGFGENLDDTVAALALFANAGIKGSDAGTLLKTTMQSITDQGNPAQGAVEALGLELYKLDASGNSVFVGFRELFRQLDVAKKKMTSQDFQAQANILFGSDAMRAAMLGNADAFDVMLDKMQRTGSASEMAAAQMQGLPGAVESFKNTTESLKLTAFEQLGPTVTNAMTQITNALSSHGPEIINFFMKVTDAALAVGANTLLGLGQTVEAIGDVGAALGEAYAISQRIYAAGQDLLGRDDEAKAARAGADAAEHYGEGIQKLGRDMQATSKLGEKFAEQLRKGGSAADGSAGQVAAFNATVSKTPKVFGPALPGGAGHGVFGPALPGTGAAASFSSANAGATGSVTSEEASRLGGGTINTSILTSLRGSNPGAKLTSGMTDHSKDSGEHPKGKAIDVDPSRENLAWAWANRDKLSMIIYDDPKYVWYNMHGERAEGAAARRIYGADTMAGHKDHIHLAALSEVGVATSSISDLVLGTSSGTGSQVPDWDAIAQKESSGRWNLPSGDRDSTGGLQIRKGTWDDFGGPGLTGQQFPYQATKDQQIAVAEKILAAQGPQAWAGGANFVWKSSDKAEKTGAATGSQLVETFSDALIDGAQSEAKQQIDHAGGPSAGAVSATGGGMDASSLGQSLVSGLLQVIGLDGSLFSNPLEWPNVKSALGAANFGGSLLMSAMGPETTGGGAVPGLGLLSGAFLKPISPGPIAPIGTAASGQGLGPAPGPAGPAVVVNGNVGMDPRAFTQRVDAAQNQSWRKHMSAVRPG